MRFNYCSFHSRYTASLYGGLVSYVASVSSASALSGRRAGCFSYGSGLVASFFSVAFSADASPGSPLHRLWQGQADVKQRCVCERENTLE